MTEDRTPRWGMPMIHPGQAQKEMTHNEALIIGDFLLSGTIEGSAGAPPPLVPDAGQGWIVSAPATGAWTGQEGRIAFKTDGGWRYLDPRPGMMLWSHAAGAVVRYDGVAWRTGEWPGRVIDAAGNPVTGERQAPIADPVAGSVIDIEARAAIAALLAAARAHGLISSAD